MEKVWFVYILQCSDGTLYTGITNDLERRIQMHSNGDGAKYTRGRGPLVLRYVEKIESYSSALRREYAIKQLPRNQKLKLIETQTPED